jgi:mannose-6-phosphate isomerase-like protein (cupin superfamily)
MNASQERTMLPTTRRIVTGHDDGGKAVVLMDGAAPNTVVRPGTGSVTSLVWVTDETPALMAGSADRADRTIGIPPPPNGSIFRVVDFQPNAPEGADPAKQKEVLATMGGATYHAHGGGPARHPFMHRTRSIDYAIVLQGEIDMLLDDSEVHLKAGDVLVQQGTNHAWVNRSGQVCRIAFVLIDGQDPLEAQASA